MKRKISKLLALCIGAVALLAVSSVDIVLAEENNQEMIDITDGFLFDIAAVLDEKMELSASGDCLYITREYETADKKNISNFVWDICQMTRCVAMDKTYSSISSVFLCGNSFESIGVQKIESLTDFTTTYIGPLSADENVKKWMPVYYYAVFGGHDSGIQSQKNMFDITNEAGMPSEFPENYQNGYFWIFSNFDMSCGYSIEDGKISVQIPKDNTYKDGADAMKKVNEALDMFNYLCNNYPDSMPYTELSIQYVNNRNTNEILWNFDTVFQNNVWNTQINRAPYKPFSSGLIGEPEDTEIVDSTQNEGESNGIISQSDIRFRDIEWGTKLKDFSSDLSLQDYNTNYMIYRIGSIQFAESAGGDDFLADGGLFMPCDNVQVAGYDTTKTLVGFMYPVEDGNIIRNDEEAQFYFGWYIFRESDYPDINSLYSDLSEKLHSLYGGSNDDEDNYSEWSTWYDSDNNFIRLYHDKEERFITIGYMAADADMHFDAIKEALKNEAAVNQEEVKDNNTDNTSGL